MVICEVCTVCILGETYLQFPQCRHAIDVTQRAAGQLPSHSHDTLSQLTQPTNHVFQRPRRPFESRETRLCGSCDLDSHIMVSTRPVHCDLPVLTC